MYWMYGESQPPTVETRKNLGRDQHRINYDIEQTTDGYRWRTLELEPGVWTYDAIVSAIITAEYPIDRMQAVVNNYLADPQDPVIVAEFEEMQSCRKRAKQLAHNLIDTEEV